MPGDLLEQTFLSREEGSFTRILMTRFLDRIGEGAPWRAIDMGTNETIKQAVIAGLGVALISRHTWTEELRAGRRPTRLPKNSSRRNGFLGTGPAALSFRPVGANGVRGRCRLSSSCAQQSWQPGQV
uniref:LysR substrate-binding domain-containing protein n=1 Tax=Paracoccus beibuensis TaxID=547602 RepID=UPI00223F8F84